MEYEMSWAATPWSPNQTVNVKKFYLFYFITFPHKELRTLIMINGFFLMLRPQTFVEDPFPNTLSSSSSV